MLIFYRISERLKHPDTIATFVRYVKTHKRKNTTAASAVLILLYTGMRVGELKTAKLYDNYIECETEKIRKGYAAVFRKIPISPMLRKVMPYIDFEKAFSASRDWIKTFLKDILPEQFP